VGRGGKRTERRGDKSGEEREEDMLWGLSP